MQHLEIRISAEYFEATISINAIYLKYNEICPFWNLRIRYSKMTSSFLPLKSSFNLKFTLKLPKIGISVRYSKNVRLHGT